MPELNIQELEDETDTGDEETSDGLFDDFDRDDLLYYMMHNPAVLYNFQVGETDATEHYDDLIALIQSLSWTIECDIETGEVVKDAESEFNDERYQGHLENIVMCLMSDLNFLLQYVIANHMPAIEGDPSAIRKALARKGFEKILLEYYVRHDHFQQVHTYTSETEIDHFVGVYPHLPVGMRGITQGYLKEASARVYGIEGE